MMMKNFQVRCLSVVLAVLMICGLQLSVPCEAFAAKYNKPHCTVKFKEAYYLSDGNVQAVFEFHNDGNRDLTIKKVSFPSLKLNFREGYFTASDASFSMKNFVRQGYYIEKAVTFTNRNKKIRFTGSPTCNYNYSVRYTVHNKK